MEKRQRERMRNQKQQDKAQRKKERTSEKRERDVNGIKDDDLAGIVPGPQPGQILDLDMD
jgi:hypothetical protein